MTRSKLPHPVTRALIDMHRGLNLGLHAETCRAAGVAIEAALADRLEDWQSRLRGTPDGSRLYEDIGVASRGPNGQSRKLTLEPMIRLVSEHISSRLGGRRRDLLSALRTVQRARNAAVHAGESKRAVPVPAEDVVEATWTAIGSLYQLGRESRSVLRAQLESWPNTESPRVVIPPTYLRRKSPRKRWPWTLALFVVGAAVGGAIALMTPDGARLLDDLHSYMSHVIDWTYPAALD